MMFSNWSATDRLICSAAAAAIVGFLLAAGADQVFRHRRAPAVESCDARCEIRMIRGILDRIERRLDAPAPTNSCDTQWPLGRPPKERNL